MSGCTLCPRICNRLRTPDDPGYCGSEEASGCYLVARLMVHHGEEPCISGIRGSGTVFFSGCSLRCCFCQNYEISLLRQGKIMDHHQLLQALHDLAALGVHNINLVTPSHYADRLPGLLNDFSNMMKNNGRHIPVVWNSSAYETVESLRGLSGLVDVFMPDFKYHDPALSSAICKAQDYFPVAGQAVLAMHHMQPEPVFDEQNLLIKGLLIRHLVLPGHWQDSCRILDFISKHLPLNTPLSLMSQFTTQPLLKQPERYPELRRLLTTLEYDKVVDYALHKGFTRIIGQNRSSAGPFYTPDFKTF